MKKRLQGFTAVELLVALVVGSLLFLSAYQLHLNVIRQSSDAQWRSVASNVAYDILRTWASDGYGMIWSPCYPDSYSGSSVDIPSYANLSGASASVAVTCPYGSSSDLSLLSVTLSYNVNGRTQQVYRAITFVAQD